jgi:hypothetical protein
MIVRAAMLASTLVMSCGPKGGTTQSGPPHVTTAASAEPLAFEIVDGDIRNYFYQQGPIATHLLVSSGVHPRVIFAFPAGNTGIGLWFKEVGLPQQLALSGTLAGVERPDGMRGVAGLLTSTAVGLELHGAVLGSIRTLRDFVYLDTKPPETEHETIAGPPLVMRRTTVDGKHHVELTLEPRDGTTITADGGRIVIMGPAGGPIHVFATALADDEPLTPIPMNSLVTSNAAASERDLHALAFLSYKEKLLAGSWRFLTYFGRDTLLSVRLLLPVLNPEVTEAALGAVLERLAPDGDVAHEEDIGDFAALRHKKEASPPSDLRQPIYDYKMVDDDFLLSPVLVAYLLDSDAGKARAKAFLARKTPSGETYAAMLEKNLELVIRRATPFADKPGATTLVAIKDGIPVGQWRDSEDGLGRGRYAFDINCALVPAALDAALRLYDSGLVTAKPGTTDTVRRLAKAWQAAPTYFRVELAADVAAARLKAYAAEQGLDPAEAVASLRGSLVFDALSLDAAGKPVPVMHTDDGFVLLFGTPSPEYLAQVAGELSRPFPAGLRTPVGMVVANPAFAADKAVRDLFTRGHYHGAVVWSWQQAMLAAGLARQIARGDLPAATRQTLIDAETALWNVIDANAAQRTGELWTWTIKDGKFVLVPFGQSGGHADESNAVQLWSTVFLGVQRPKR